MPETILTSYDDVPYLSRPHYPTHPDCLATVARLFGMQTADIDNCRVLELGCAAGGNLIPMAESLPNSRFTGIDLSPRQVAEGQTMVDDLNLKNIDLRAMSILDVNDDFGQFDYIICHGVYSWVPPAVQEKILEICKRNLAPQGVAYVSYNTYPGWHARGVVREMMSYHVQQFEEPAVRVQQARAFLEFLVDSSPEPEGSYARLLREEAELIRPGEDYYVFHEHLEDVNQPIYFHQFAGRLAAGGLQYLGEAWFHTKMFKYPGKVQDTLRSLSRDLVSLEQYVDFLENRTFRRTIVCHGDVRLDRSPTTETIAGLSLSALARPISPRPDIASTQMERFQADDGSTASTNAPAVKAALITLFEAWPQSVKFKDLWTAVCHRLEDIKASADSTSPELLAEAMLQCYMTGMVALHVHPARFELAPGEWPVASALARRQSAVGAPIANLRHRTVELDEADRFVLGHLDGNHDRPAILNALETAVADGALTLDAAGANGQPAAMPDWLESSLHRLAQSALVVS